MNVCTQPHKSVCVCVQVDVRTIHGSTPLCHACAAGSIESVKLLVDHGASVNPSLTALTASPLHEACIRGETARRSNALCLDFCFIMMVKESASLCR